jgi:hypothetical protein
MSLNYVDLAETKFYQTKEIHWGLTFKEFICECYVKLNPCSYGSRVAEKIRLMLDAYSVSPRDGRGDISLNNLFYEQKVSYLSNVNNSWSLTHLRPWQKFNYYIFCLVDCEDNFSPNFYVIDKISINKFNLGAMSGTSESNHNNSNIELRTNILKNSDSHKLLKKINLLSDTSFKSLEKFVLKTK